MNQNNLNLNTAIWKFSLGSFIVLLITAFGFCLFTSINEYLQWKFEIDLIKNENKKFLVKKILLLSCFDFLFGFIYRFLFIESLFEEENNLISNLKLSLKRKEVLFSVYDISLAGILFSLFLIVGIVNNFTALRLAKLDFEYVFYVIFAYFFGKWKGTFLSFMADFFNLLFAGRIAFYHEAYAIVPIVATFLIAITIEAFKKQTKITLIFMDIFLFAVFGVLLYVFLSQENIEQGIKISKTFGLSSLSLSAFIVLLVLSFLILITFNVFGIFYFVSKNEKFKKNISYFILAYFLTVSLIVLARWIWGPFAFIMYANRYLGRGYNLSDRYIIVMIPIILRSLISIPIYATFLYVLLPTLDKLKEVVINRKIQTRYA